MNDDDIIRKTRLGFTENSIREMLQEGRADERKNTATKIFDELEKEGIGVFLKWSNIDEFEKYKQLKARLSPAPAQGFTARRKRKRVKNPAVNGTASR